MRATSTVLILLAASALAACKGERGVGYVEIKTAPTLLGAPPPLYLGSTKLQPFKKGVAVLAQPVGTVTLQLEGGGGKHLPLCEIMVRKDRITTVTLSALERPPRCHCRISGGAENRVCVS